MSKLEDLIESLEVRHFGDEKKFLQVYGKETWDKFAGVIPIFIKFREGLVEEVSEKVNVNWN